MKGSIAIVFLLLYSCRVGDTAHHYSNKNNGPIIGTSKIEAKPKEGYGDTNKNNVNRESTKLEDTKFSITIGDPYTLYRAQTPQKWGFVQFPRLFRTIEGDLTAVWNMNPDDTRAKTRTLWSRSKDEGETWDFKSGQRPINPGTKLSNGEYLKFTTRYIKENTLNLPKPTHKDEKRNTGAEFNFYRRSELKEEYNVFHINRIGDNKKVEPYTALRRDTISFAHSQRGMFSFQAWGDLIETSSNDLIKVIYPDFISKNGRIQPSGISFYRSENKEFTKWSRLSAIPFEFNDLKQYGIKPRNVQGFSEPAFLRVSGDTLLSVFRSDNGREAPLFQSISVDSGSNWSMPEAITSFGVLPQLLKLNNGITVCSYGRPGVEIIFNESVSKSTWSSPVSLVPKDGTYSKSSCGYTGLIAINDNSFIIVYANFKSEISGVKRKAIEVRKITVNIRK